MKFNKLFSALVVLMLASSVTFAQVNRNYDGVKPEVVKGAKNFVFMYTPFQSTLMSAPAGSFSAADNMGNLYEMNLAGIGFRYFVSNEFSLGGGLNFGTASKEMTVGTGVAKVDETSFGISVDGNYHMPSLYSVTPYVGLNVNFGMGSVKNDDGFGTVIEDKGNAFGVGANFGFDWYFTEGISLGGKYTLGFKNLSEPERVQTGGVNPGTTKGPKGTMIGTGIMSVIMNVHF